MHRARVISAQVLERKREGKHGPAFWEGLLTYSYTIPGHELEVGEARKRFFDEGHADEWARAMRDAFVEVRVDPDDPTRSVWQETSFDFALAIPPPADAGAGGWGLLTFLILCVSSLGAALAAWIQLASVVGRPVMTMARNEGEFFGMHIGAIVCAAASAFVVSKAKPSGLRIQRELFEGGSMGTRLLQGLGVYSSLVFFYGWVRSASHSGEPAGWTVLIFSAAWLVFYATSAMTCWKGMQDGTAG